VPNPNAIVGRIIQIGLPGPPQTFAASPGALFATVQIQGGAVCHLDMNDQRASVWNDVLQDVAQSQEPVYLETNATTGVIQGVLIPDTQYVTGLKPLPTIDKYEVEFSDSHARHFLTRGGPADSAYASNLAMLRTALSQGTAVLVSETLDTLEILDVRPPTTPFVAAPALAPIMGVAAGAPPAFSSNPCPGPPPISMAQAAILFGQVSAPACPTVAPTAPCIPFAYPVDGCWGRAHEMARIMDAAGYPPCKVWCFGTLNPGTRFSSTCFVSWGWHVAPILPVATGSGASAMVFDPSMFTLPVPIATWVAVQNDPGATWVTTSWDVFNWTTAGAVVFDPFPYTQTQSVLRRYRRRLALLAGSAAGSPPYSACPAPYPNAP
jgi:Glutaminase